MQFINTETTIEEPIFLDNHLIAVYKPFGIPTQPDRPTQISLLGLTKDWLKKKYNKPGNVFLGLLHRLDRPVAGIVLFARTTKAASRLSAQFREKTIKKYYQASVLSQPKQPEGTLVHYLRKERSLKATVFPRETKGTKRAELSYRTLKSTSSGNVLEILPKTGRFHQIRAQLSFTGTPIIGDLKYGAPFPLPGKKIALLAYKLCFKHPITKEPIQIECHTPKDWPFELN
jgi:23S rRNA pseudouridine1911/1915/1917 synthase